MLIGDTEKLLVGISVIMAELERFKARLEDLRDDAYRVVAREEEIAKGKVPDYFAPDINPKILAAAKRASLDLSYELPKWRKAVMK